MQQIMNGLEVAVAIDRLESRNPSRFGLMTRTRVAAGVLATVLAALLGWTVVAGVGDMRLRIVLGVGIVLGATYAAVGRLPDWLISGSSGSLTADDDPSNLSPQLYLPIILAAILVAAIVLGLGILWL